MWFKRSLFYFIILHSIVAQLQINLERTEWVRNNENDDILQHDCLNVAAPIEKEKDSRHIISYCMGELSSKWNIQKNNIDQNWTFAELYKQQITSRQLYLWSAPMDIVERYQLYLNEVLSSSETSIGTELFYNCTLPRFGPLCQYEFDDYTSDHLSLNEIIHDFYLYEHKTTTMTCYLHLQCNRGPAPACLDWSEICDGKRDCLDGGQDEEYCWQLEENQCNDDEYRCINGQCIPIDFFRDDPNVPDCLDRSDEILGSNKKLADCDITEPIFACEDVICIMHSNVYHNSPLTSSCVKQRENQLMEAMYFSKPDFVSTECWSAFICMIYIPHLMPSQKCNYCDKQCRQIILQTCPDFMLLPNIPVLFGHVYFAYNASTIYSKVWPEYICFNSQLCREFRTNGSFLSFNNVTCHHSIERPVLFTSTIGTFINKYLRPTFNFFLQCNVMINNSFGLCNNPTMYQCMNSSKCISIYRLRDGVRNCYHNDDEELIMINKTFSLELFKTHFKCERTNEYIAYHLVNDGVCHCKEYADGFCDDEATIVRSIGMDISFTVICDGFIELYPVIINGQQETDETNCEQWICNNTYTRCDGFWNCLNGADEVDCHSSSLINCPSRHYLCVSPNTTQLICLPIEKANDGKLDCLGGTDEPKLCRSKNHTATKNNFYCRNDNYRVCVESEWLCDGRSQCMREDDEAICDVNRYEHHFGGICRGENEWIRSDVENFFCERLNDTRKQQIVYFSLDENRNLINHSNTVLSNSSQTRPIREHQRRCHRGLDLRVWIDREKNLTSTTCLCPPSFYGDQCQYQNQRVSLTMQIRALSDAWQTPFTFIVSLIDDDDKRTIHSYEQFTYLPMRDCQIKFNIYLLYSNRPKISTRQYSVHIDIYEKFSFVYRGSWLVPLTFPFLPVHRLAIQLNIPHSSTTVEIVESCSNHQCVHGRCVQYLDNSLDNTFCQCDQGWSGRYCTIPHNCMCSHDSLCIGLSADNRSICICPIDKLGSRCLLDNPICQLDQNMTCYNGGRCIPNDEHTTGKKFTCICPKGFSGERCEIPDTKIIVSFHKNIDLSQSMIIHFIEIFNDAQPGNASTFKTIPIYQDSVTIYWSRPFHIVFIELFNKYYYLTVVQKKYSRSATIIKTIEPLDRCEHLSEILNETIGKYHLLRRIKYYHVPCQRLSPPLSCFYDDDYFCLCKNYGEQRVANCFKFNHQSKRDCFGQSGCENGAQCFQDNPTCAQTSLCVCPACFYGTRCQFSTNGFSLSLDAILGYHILPSTSIGHQPDILKVSIALNILIIIAGLINGILSMITFVNKKLREVGCGIYLLSSSIITLLTIIMFALKFWILILVQMTLIGNRSFIYWQCILIDFLLRICLTMDQWLSVCVTIERAITIRQGVKFNKAKSKKMAKLTIFVLLFLTISTAIHEPIYRRIIDDVDGDQKRLWCTLSYPSAIRIYDSVVHISHILIPFLINLFAAVAIITGNARQRSTIRTQQTYQQLLREQFQQHNHIIISAFILVVLACPRLILSFVSGCMKSSQQSQLFLVGYFISYISTAITFMIFVLPSKRYKTEFRKSMERHRTMIRTRINNVSCFSIRNR